MTTGLASTSRMGRPRVEFDMTAARLLLVSGMPVIKAAPLLGVSRGTLHRRMSEIHEFREDVRLPSFRNVKRAVNAMDELFIVTPETHRRCWHCGQTKTLATGFYFKKQQEVYRRKCKDCCKADARFVWHEVGKHSRWVNGRHDYRPRSGSPLLRLFYPYLTNADQTEGAALIRLINRAVPRQWKEELRSEICQELALAVLSAEITIAEISTRIREFAKRQYTLLAGRNFVSFDQPVREGSSLTLLDVLAAPEPSTEEDDYRQCNGRATITSSIYGSALADCESAKDYAARLKDAWDANRLSGGNIKTYGQFARAKGSYGDTAYTHLRRKYALINGRVHAHEVPVTRFGGAWSPETALPEEQREPLRLDS